MRAMEQEKMEMREEIQQLASRIEETAPRNIFFEGTARPVSPPKPKRPPHGLFSAVGGWRDVEGFVVLLYRLAAQPRQA